MLMLESDAILNQAEIIYYHKDKSSFLCVSE